jgi:hypothetical protein
MVRNTEQANTESFLLYSTSGCILMARLILSIPIVADRWAAPRETAS